MSHKKEPEDFKVPNLIHFTPVSSGDLSLVMALKHELEASGILDDETRAKQELTTAEAAADLLKEATDLAKDERELNPAFHNEAVEAYVALEGAHRRRTREWVNPNVLYEDD